jgi:hypothetical protein
MLWNDKCNMVVYTELCHVPHHRKFKASHSLADSQWLVFQQQDSDNQALRAPNMAAGTKMILRKETSLSRF